MNREEIKKITDHINRLKIMANSDRLTGYPKLAAEREQVAGWLDRLLTAEAKLERLSKLNVEGDCCCD